LKYGLFDVLYLPGLGEFLVNEREPSEIIWFWCHRIAVACKLDKLRKGIALNKVWSGTMTEHEVWDWGSHSVDSGKYHL
jgi:hypothetical protein